MNEDLSNFSMLDLFRAEAEGQTQALTAGLLALESTPTAKDQLEGCMRAAHSLKGAARIVGIGAGVGLAHVMEECFVTAQRGQNTLRKPDIDLLLQGVDLLGAIAKTAEADLGQWNEARKTEVDQLVAALTRVAGAGGAAATQAPIQTPVAAPPQQPVGREEIQRRATDRSPDQAVRVTADSLNRLLGLAGEVLVESRRLKPFSDSLLRLKRLHHASTKAVENMREVLPGLTANQHLTGAVDEVQSLMRECQYLLSQRLNEIETFDRRATGLAHRLYEEALASRMRPFSDGTQVFPRMVRDLAAKLGKQARLDVIGGTTQVDRNILEKLDAPLGHLLRNAIDHGIETPEVRRAAGKPGTGVITLEARHSAGKLLITVADDGAGIDLDAVRAKILERGLTTAETAAKMSESEVLEFLFLPSFSTKSNVTDVSGRGVGLDVVQDMVKQVRGTARISTERGRGTRFLLQMPLTLSVVRTLLVDVAGQPYAFPLAFIGRTLKIAESSVIQTEGRQHFTYEGTQAALVTAHQILGLPAPELTGDEFCVVVLGDERQRYGVVVDRFIGERELVVQPLDSRLGKVKDISAAAVMDDGSQVLIVDIDDMIRSVEKLAAAGSLTTAHHAHGAGGSKSARKRILVVDDSLTVRELERKLLTQQGYDVEVETDGMAGWNTVRTGHFDLVVTDVDMPRMDGIELVTLIKRDVNLKGLPVMIVSYKDREEDRQRGLEAGADYYLTKGSFHDQTLVQAVTDLIGEARA